MKTGYVPGSVKRSIYWNLLVAQKGECAGCGKQEWETGSRHQMHRLVPGTDGGNYADGNCELRCFACHHGEHTRLMKERLSVARATALEGWSAR